MDVKAYFSRVKGRGFLATADAAGEVDIAVYSRPRVLEDGTLVFGMADRLTHANLTENPHAVYAFHEGAFRGVRLFLEKIGEEEDGPLLDDVRARAAGLGLGWARRRRFYDWACSRVRMEPDRGVR